MVGVFSSPPWAVWLFCGLHRHLQAKGKKSGGFKGSTLKSLLQSRLKLWVVFKGQTGGGGGGRCEETGISLQRNYVVRDRVADPDYLVRFRIPNLTEPVSGPLEIRYSTWYPLTNIFFKLFFSLHYWWIIICCKGSG